MFFYVNDWRLVTGVVCMVQQTISMRSKEGLADYRYFPEPDLPEVVLSQEYIDTTRANLPELPDAKRRRYESLGLSMQDTLVLANDSDVSLFIEIYPMFYSLQIIPKPIEILLLAGNIK